MVNKVGPTPNADHPTILRHFDHGKVPGVFEVTAFDIGPVFFHFSARQISSGVSFGVGMPGSAAGACFHRGLL
jgi:hypothetical protein